MASLRCFTLFFCLFCTLLVSVHSETNAYVESAFENSAIVRTIELAGSLVHVRTTVAAKALEGGSRLYTFTVGREDAEKISFVEARIKGEKETLQLQHFGLNQQTDVYTYAAVLPKGLKKNEEITLEFETVQTHATYPWPAAVAQNEVMSLKYETDLFVVSPYETKVQRTKIRAPSPKIISYTEPKGAEEFTFEAPVTKASSTVTYGPYNNIPVSASGDFLKDKQTRVTVHYQYDTPVMEITKMIRMAEISHWGNNINIQDGIWLRNAGPQLKGHFSRLDHQKQTYTHQPVGHVFRGVSLRLPPGIRDTYFIDTVGNVSTSHLRSAPSVPKGVSTKQTSLLELKPRYPLMGGWNYTYTVGFDAPLNDWAAYDRSNGKHIVAVPIFTQYPDTVISEAEVKVILPEGATDLEVYPPFAPLTVKTSTHHTYLDTKGRPAVSFYYENLTDEHFGFIYVAYKVSFTEHLRKPVIVSMVFFGLFVLSTAARRVNMNIRQKDVKN